MALTLFDSRGLPIQLGHELGKGGEGSVFEVPASPGQVAKLYHKLPDKKKQEKLKLMVAQVDLHLLTYTAWPQETLYQAKNGALVGFLMPKVVGLEPIHMLYSPAHRKQNWPEATWVFLLYAARNIAAAFEVLHSRGYVLGDVNQGNVMVGRDSKVVLIDCDSIQINAASTAYLCEVGVSHFTPPELQGLTSFLGFKRNANHDNFGLALLIFHLLFGGRHPYAGVPLKSDVGESLESDIRSFRYAYAKNAKSRGLLPPPRSIPISIVPEKIEAMLDAAFTEKGASNQRPTASQWVTELDRAIKTRVICTSTRVHVYSNVLVKCPWCALEQQGVVVFVDYGINFTSLTSEFDLVKIWALVESIPSLTLPKIPDLNEFPIIPDPLPKNFRKKLNISIFRFFIIAVIFFGIVFFQNLWILWVVGGVVGWLTSLGAAARCAEECARRRAAMDTAQREFDSLVDQIRKDMGPQGFQAKKAELIKVRDEYIKLPLAEKAELDHMLTTAYDRQQRLFLERCFIDNATISGVGPSKKAALRSFGIETAADVDADRVRQVRGFGDVLTRAVVAWKTECKSDFKFDSNNRLSEADKKAVRTQFATRKAALETTLRGGMSELQRIRTIALSRYENFRPKLLDVARRLAQAKSDFSLVE